MLAKNYTMIPLSFFRDEFEIFWLKITKILQYFADIFSTKRIWEKNRVEWNVRGYIISDCKKINFPKPLNLGAYGKIARKWTSNSCIPIGVLTHKNSFSSMKAYRKVISRTETLFDCDTLVGQKKTAKFYFGQFQIP